jgi:hypothetical protein
MFIKHQFEIEHQKVSHLLQQFQIQVPQITRCILRWIESLQMHGLIVNSASNALNKKNV